MNELSFAPSSERNKGPILDRLLEWLPHQGTLLEIGAGTGQHAVHFAPRFPGLAWQTSDCPDEVPGLAARLAREGSPNLPPPIELDVLLGPWPEHDYSAAYSANTAHIMHWEAVCAMFAGLGSHLVAGAPFCLYGPFNRNGEYTAPSNAAFDRHLRARDANMGLRDVGALESLAGGHQMRLEQDIEMPTNNLMLVFRRMRS
jgi:hypothetical protein